MKTIAIANQSGGIIRISKTTCYLACKIEENYLFRILSIRTQIFQDPLIQSVNFFSFYDKTGEEQLGLISLLEKMLDTKLTSLMSLFPVFYPWMLKSFENPCAL